MYTFSKTQIIDWRQSKAISQEADADGSGSVDFGEFVEMMIKVFGITDQLINARKKRLIWQVGRKHKLSTN